MKVKSISLKEVKKDLIKTLEIMGNEYAIAEILSEEGGIHVNFKFNMRYTLSNPTFFKNASLVMTKYQAYLSLEPRQSRDGLFIELAISMKASEVKP